MKRRLWLVAFLATATLGAPSAFPSGDDLLDRILARAAQNLRGLPDYTCLQTIERSERSAPSRPFELIDRVRLEVAFVDNKELFGWPGVGKFEETDIGDLVQNGAIGSGNFALHAHAVFLSRGPSFTYSGEEVRDGRPVVRYNYRLPRAESGYLLRRPPREALVGHHGSFWVDAATLDLVRLEVIADDIPPELQISEAADNLSYKSVRIGAGDFLLPSSSELLLTDTGGASSRNLTQFGGCRQFSGQAVLSFDGFDDVEPGAEAPRTKRIIVPPGLDVDLELDTEIDTLTAAVGDAVNLRVAREVKSSGVVLVPGGAIVGARVSVLRRGVQPYPHYAIALRPYSLDFGGAHGDFAARLTALGTLAGYTTYNQVPPAIPSARTRQSLFLGSPVLQSLEPGFFAVTGLRVRLPRGFRTSWKTE